LEHALLPFRVRLRPDASSHAVARPPIHLDLDLQKRGEGRKQKEMHPMGSDGEGAAGGGKEAEDGRALTIPWRK